MKSIQKNKMPLLISLILVVVMMFGSVCYASSDEAFSDDDFKDTGYSDGSLRSIDDTLEFAGAIDVNNSGMYQEAVKQWGIGNVDSYYVITSSSHEDGYMIYSRHYLFCEKGTNIGLCTVHDSKSYKHYHIKSSARFMQYRKYMISRIGTWDESKDYNMTADTLYTVTYGVLDKDCTIVATNLPRFGTESLLDNYLLTGDPSGADNYNNPDSDDSSAFKWDSFKGVLSGANADKGYGVVIDRSYSSSNMITHPEDYYINVSAAIKIVGKDKNGSVRTGSYNYSFDDICLRDFCNGYFVYVTDSSLLSVYGDSWSDFWLSADGVNRTIETAIRICSSFVAGQSPWDIEITSCRLYFTFKLYCKGNGFYYGRYSDDVRCLSFDLLDYDGSTQGGEEVDPAEGTEDGSGNGSGNGSGSGSGSGQGVNININNQNTQNNGSSSSDPKLDVTDDDFSMANVWKNIKSLFGLIDDPSTPEPDDGVMQMVKAGMGFMPSEYWTMILGLLSSAGIVSMIRIFRGS